MIGKKVVGLILIACITLGIIAGCTKFKDETDEDSEIELEDLVGEIYEGIEVPQYETIQLNEENFEYFAFIPYEQDIKAVAADALVNIEAHSLVLIYTEKDNALDLATKIFENANPNKWLCVGAEQVNVAYSNHYVMLVMSSEDLAESITNNFELVVNKLYDGNVTVLSADNTIREFE